MLFYNVWKGTPLCTLYFYPRPPRGGRPTGTHSQMNGVIFLSTPSARRATRAGDEKGGEQYIFLSTPSARRATYRRWKHENKPNNYFYPRPPRGGRPLWHIIGNTIRVFLSTPSARRATGAISSYALLLEFLSTPSARRATANMPNSTQHICINLHIS